MAFVVQRRWKPEVALIAGYWVLLLSQFRGEAQLLRDRSVQCNSNEMLVTFEFSQPFNGVVYAKRFYDGKGCRWEGDGSRRLQTPIPLSSNPNSQTYCGVQAKEITGEFFVTLYISPMKGLLVDGMDILEIRCLYTVGDVTLTLSPGTNGLGLEISPHTQRNLVTGSGGSPFLQMTIRDGHGINGEVIQSAQVGQRITLDILMKDTTIYDFYVHSCYAHDGSTSSDASVNIIDPNGCAVRLPGAVDVPAFTTPPVPNGGKHVYVHMYGFLFTTSQFVYFDCQVRPCLQTCNRPQCANAVNGSSSSVATTVGATSRSSRTQREISSGEEDPSIRDLRSSENYNLTAVIKVQPKEVVAFTPAAASRDAPFRGDDRRGGSSRQPQVCINTGAAISVLVVFVVVCVVSLAIAAFVCYRARADDQESWSRSSSVVEQHRHHPGMGHAVASVDFYSTVSSPSSRQLTPIKRCSS